MLKTKTWLALLLTLACAGALAAAAPTPAATPTPAVTAVLSGLSGPPAGAQYVFINHCEPPTRFVCVNKSCWCGVSCGSAGVKSFTCDPSTGVSSCVCN